MIVLSVHNHYQQPGGEDESTALEVELLRSHGHEVIEYREHNDRIHGMTKLRVAARTIWSQESYRDLRTLIRNRRPDVVHVQNFFPLVSPSAFYAANAEGIPVVQSLRNYRLLCPGATFSRHDRVCEECLGKVFPLPGIRHGCYRGSRTATTVVAAMLSSHRLLGTWTQMVNVYIALTEFVRAKFIEGGLPAEKIVVKPNFVSPDPGVRHSRGEYAVFLGRLSEEKGILTLIQAWKQVNDLPLHIVGDGPLTDEVRGFISKNGLSERIRLLGRVPSSEVPKILHGARYLVFPSTWYETFGRVALESFACGVPVIASNLGAIAEIVNHKVSGLLFTSGNVDSLATTLRWANSHPEEMDRMGQQARRIFETSYSPEANYEALVGIYQRAIETCASSPSQLGAG
jgi:glycosyltransferase involved in cell wall biosynthesis